MAGIQRRSFRTPDERAEYPLGATDEVHLGERVVGKSTQLPGWRWSDHIRPITGTPSCQLRHIGVVLAGRFGVRLDTGAEMTFEPDDVYDIPPGHDGYVLGDQPATIIEWAGVHGWATPPVGDRVLATILFRRATALRIGRRLDVVRADIRDESTRFTPGDQPAPLQGSDASRFTPPENSSASGTLCGARRTPHVNLDDS